MCLSQWLGESGVPVPVPGREAAALQVGPRRFRVLLSHSPVALLWLCEPPGPLGLLGLFRKLQLHGPRALCAWQRRTPQPRQRAACSVGRETTAPLPVAVWLEVMVLSSRVRQGPWGHSETGIFSSSCLGQGELRGIQEDWTFALGLRVALGGVGWSWRLPHPMSGETCGRAGGVSGLSALPVPGSSLGEVDMCQGLTGLITMLGMIRLIILKFRGDSWATGVCRPLSHLLLALPPPVSLADLVAEGNSGPLFSPAPH